MAAVPRTPGPGPRSVPAPRPRTAQPLACVLGDIDIVSPLGLGGVRCVPVADRRDPARFSRFAVDTIAPLDHWAEPDGLVARLLEWAHAQPATPILFYGSDRDLLLVSRWREALREAFRFVIADREQVEDLTDKARFQRLAERLDLPVPPARRLTAASGPAPALELRFPLAVKPPTREGLGRLGFAAKAVRVDSSADLERLWPQVVAAGVEVIAQELIDGPETRIESYHAYIDPSGDVAGEFTGVKIRTDPPAFGHSTAVRITCTEDVMASGRGVLAALGLRGVVKLDYKRDPEGRLHLLEVNPRFSLWHHPGAVAGVNLPALVYADLTGRKRPTTRLRPGTTWCNPQQDRWAARAAGIPMVHWLAWAVRCDTRSGADLNDPMPFLRGEFLPAVGERITTRLIARLRARVRTER